MSIPYGFTADEEDLVNAFGFLLQPEPPEPIIVLAKDGTRRAGFRSRGHAEWTMMKLGFRTTDYQVVGMDSEEHRHWQERQRKKRLEESQDR